MEHHKRNDIRLLSSLKDLKLGTKCQMILTQERKRQHKRLGPLKGRSEDDVIYENFTMADKKKTPFDMLFIAKSLAQHFTFSTLIQNKHMQDQVIDKFRLCKVEQKQYLLRQFDSASSFFILKEGELSVEINGQAKNGIKIGQGFGELSLLYSTPRSASILAKKTSFLWFIDRTTFRNVVSSIIQKTYTENKKFIEMNKFFSYLTAKQKEKMTAIAINQRYEKGAKLCLQGQLASSMFIIKKGKLKRLVNGQCVGFYESGDSLQEYAALTKNCLRKQTIYADELTQVLAFGAEDIEKNLGRSLPLIILRNNAKKALLLDKHMKHLTKEFMEKVIDCFKIRNVSAGDYAFRQEDFCKNKILFIIEGEYQLSKNQQKSMLYGSECIGESRMVTYKMDCMFKTDGKLVETTLQEIEQSLDCTIIEAIQKSASVKKAIQYRASLLLDLQNLSKQYDLKDFSVLKKLGEGQFGQVFLVVSNKTNKVYALKCISKVETLKYKLQRHLINEKKVLEQHSCPFTVDFIRSFNDQNYVYFLTQFIDGLELFDALRLIGIVPINLAKFYIATILYAIQSLHSNYIVYRDLKPENVMVQSDGYLKIIDMGTCKNLKSTASNKTFTIIGTPNYMAPQILSGKGYSYSVDLWSLGIILFQFLAGYLPFGEHCDDPYQIYEQILTTQLKFPKYLHDYAANKLIMRLLNRNCEARLGQSYTDLKNHDFFRQIEWDQLIEKKLLPPFRPPIDYLIKIDTLMKNKKPLEDFLKHIPQPILKRMDISPNWDNCF